MRKAFAPVLIAFAMVACGGVDDPPLGGPFGGTTDPTDPSAGQNGDTTGNTGDTGNTGNTGTDGGTTTTTKDSGTTSTTKDSGTTTTKDSGTTSTQDSGSSQTQSAPTWTQIFNSYLAGSTKGRCSSCHSQGSSKSNLYSWLQSKGYISGANSALVDPNSSCLSWYGGNMPPSGPGSWSSAESDMNAWAAAGAQNN